MNKFDIEKKAALDMLVERGVDFDTAVELVEKKAGEVARRGTDVDLHLKDINMNPSKLRSLKRAGKIGAAVAGVGAVAAGAAYGAKKMTEKRASFNAAIEEGLDFESAVEKAAGAKALPGPKSYPVALKGKSKLGLAAAVAGGVAAAGGAAYGVKKKMEQEKKAAVDMLVEQGVDFDTACNLVMEKAALLGTITGALSAESGHRGKGALGGFIGGDVAGNIAGATAGAVLTRGNFSAARAGGLAGQLAGGYAAGKHFGKDGKK